MIKFTEWLANKTEMVGDNGNMPSKLQAIWTNAQVGE